MWIFKCSNNPRKRAIAKYKDWIEQKRRYMHADIALAEEYEVLYELDPEDTYFNRQYGEKAKFHRDSAAKYSIEIMAMEAKLAIYLAKQ